MTYDPASNGRDGYSLALRAWREWCIRTRTPPKPGAALIEPNTDEERRWQAEGRRPVPELDTVRNR